MRAAQYSTVCATATAQRWGIFYRDKKVMEQTLANYAYSAKLYKELWY